MKAALVRVKADGVLELDEREIAILNYLCSYDLAKIMFDKMGKKYTLKEIEGVVQSLRDATSRIMNATTEASEHIFDERQWR